MELLESILEAHRRLSQLYDAFFDRSPQEGVSALSTEIPISLRLDDDDPDRTTHLDAILCLLEQVQEPHGLDLLVSLLTHPDKELRKGALNVLANKMLAPSTELLERLERATKTSSVAAALILQLLRSIPEDDDPARAIAKKIYLEFLGHENAGVTLQAIVTAAEYEGSKAVSLLTPLCEDGRVTRFEQEGEEIEMTLGTFVQGVLERITAP